MKTIFFDALYRRRNIDLQRTIDSIEINPIDIWLGKSSYGIHTSLDEAAKKKKCYSWRVEPDAIGSYPFEKSGLDALINRDIIELEEVDIRCDIADIGSFSASGGDMRSYTTIAAFGEKNYNFYRGDFTHLTEEQYFHHCLRSGLFGGGRLFSFSAWAPDLHWENDGASHRLSTAVYMAKKFGYRHVIDGTCALYKVDTAKLLELHSQYYVYIFKTSYSDYMELYDLFQGICHSSNRMIILQEFEQWYSDLPDIVTYSETGSMAEQEPRFCFLLIDRKARVPKVLKYWLEKLPDSYRLFSFLNNISSKQRQGLQLFSKYRKEGIPDRKIVNDHNMAELSC